MDRSDFSAELAQITNEEAGLREEMAQIAERLIAALIPYAQRLVDESAKGSATQNPSKTEALSDEELNAIKAKVRAIRDEARTVLAEQFRAAQWPHKEELKRWRHESATKWVSDDYVDRSHPSGGSASVPSWLKKPLVDHVGKVGSVFAEKGYFGPTDPSPFLLVASAAGATQRWQYQGDLHLPSDVSTFIGEYKARHLGLVKLSQRLAHVSKQRAEAEARARWEQDDQQ